MTRKATSPRLEIRIFLNIGGCESEQPLTVLHWLSVLDVDFYHLTVDVGIDFVHQLHRLDDAEYLPFLDDIADFRKCSRARFRRSEKGPHYRRLHDRKIEFFFRRCQYGRGGRHIARLRGRYRRTHHWWEIDVGDRRQCRRPLTAWVLANPQLEVVTLELEFRELVLPHHVQNLLQLVEINHSNARSSRVTLVRM